MPKKLLRYFTADSRVAGKGSLFASLAINIILLYVVNNLRYMGITQLIEANLVSCLWALNIVFGLAICGNFILLLFHQNWLFYLIQILIHIAGMNAFFFVYKLYPFNLASTLQNQIVRVVIIVVMAVFFIAFITNFYRLGMNIKFPQKKTLTATSTTTDGTLVTSQDSTVAAEPVSGEIAAAPPDDKNEALFNGEPAIKTPPPAPEDKPATPPGENRQTIA